MADKIEAKALAEKCEVAAHNLTFPFMALSIKEQHEAAAVLRECAEAIKAADTEINALRTLLGDAAEKLTQTEAVRALAQGEPGEATPAPPPCATCNGEGGWERANSSTSYSWQKCPHCHLSPTASAPAAERPPYCGSGHCSCIECPYGETNER